MKKKILCLLLALLLACLLVACGEEETGGDGGQAATPPASTPDTPQDPTESVNYALCFTVENGTVTGLTDYGLANCTELKIPKSIEGQTVTAIGAFAFRDCSGIKKLTLPESVTRVDNTAFDGCTALVETVGGALYVDNWLIGTAAGATELVLRAGTVGIADRACTGNTTITQVIFEKGAKLNSLAYIGEEAFKGCTALDKFVAGTGLLHVYDGAFWGCTALKSQIVPALTVGNSAFRGCTALPNFIISTKLTTIGSYAFRDCTALQYVGYHHYDSAISSIGTEAFYGCTSLYSFALPSRDTVTIGKNAFFGCWRLAEVLFGKSSAGTKTDDYLYYYASKVYHSGASRIHNENGFLFLTDDAGGLPYLVTYVGTDNAVVLPKGYGEQNYRIRKYAFAYNHEIFSVTIPAGVVAIEENAFLDCPNLVRTANGVSYVDTWIVNAENVNLKYAPEKSTLGIADGAFKNCDKLFSLTLTENLLYIGKDAFLGCKRLYEVVDLSPTVDLAAKYVGTSSAIESVNDYVFFDNGEAAYLIAYNGSDTVLRLPAAPKGTPYTVDAGAFEACKNATAVYFPADVIAVEADAFARLSSLQRVTAESVAAWCGIRFATQKSNPLYVVKHLYVGENELTDLTLPTGITEIGNYAFYGCEGLKRVTFAPECSITAIGAQAFRGCTGLLELALPATLTEIGDNALTGCNAIEKIEITNVGAWCGMSFAGMESNPLSHGAKLFVNGTLLTTLEVPAHVTEIGKYAFAGYQSLEVVYFAMNSYCTVIGDGAFHGCTALTALEFNNAALLKTVYTKAFSSCTSLVGVSFHPSTVLDYLGPEAFAGCTSLQEITLPPMRDYIRARLFKGCTALRSFVTPAGADSVMEGAFAGCTALNRFVLGSDVDHIGKNAFADCYHLVQIRNDSDLALTVGSSDLGGIARYAIDVTAGGSLHYTAEGNVFYKREASAWLISLANVKGDITLPSDFEGSGYAIYKYAFFDCDELTSVIIPGSVTTIGEHAFANCDNLTAITVKAGVYSIQAYAFVGCGKLTSAAFEHTRWKFDKTVLPNMDDPTAAAAHLTSNHDYYIKTWHSY